MNATELNIGAAFLLGLLGSSHCLAMCGGLGAALGMATDTRRRPRLILGFQFGRIGSYMLLGAGLGALLGLLDSPRVLPVLRLVSGLLLVGMGLYLANWWLGLQALERAGGLLWRRVQPLTRRHLPVRKIPDALAVGLCWGLLPCGLIYSALGWSAAASSGMFAAVLMMFFGLGTLPAMFATGVAGQQLTRVLTNRHLRAVAAALMIALGGWTAAGAALEGLTGAPGSPHHHH